MKTTRRRSTASVVFERVIAAVVVLGWAIAAHFYFDFSAALGVVALLLFPLAFIWFPELLSREAGKASPELLQPDLAVHPTIVRLLGWIVIIVVPAVLGIFNARGIAEWHAL